MGKPEGATWVTGASGMLGSTLLKTLPDRSLGISRRPTADGRSCDLSDPSQVRALFSLGRPSLVIHCAAYSDVDGCERDPKSAHEANALAVKNLAQACSEADVPWIHVSTDYVFDGAKRSLYKEGDPTGPVNIYGMTKLAGEHYALAGKAPCVVVRTSWLFGAPKAANFVNAMMARLLKEKEVSVLDDQVDCPTHVKDLSMALLAIGDRLVQKKPKNEVYHVCNHGTATRHEMTVRMRDWLGLSTVVKKADRSQIAGRVAVRPAYVAMSPELFESQFRFRLRPWEESLKEYVLEARCAS